MEHAGHTSPAVGTPVYNLNLQLDPPQPLAGEAEGLSIVVTEQAVGDPISEFELLHEKAMHLIAVSEDLAHFDHVHPELRDGAFRIRHAFPAGGAFKLWAETKPAGGTPVLAAFRVAVAPGIRSEPATATASPYRVTLQRPDHIRLHDSIDLRFRVETADGQPVEDLEPLMGAGGHCVIISSDLKQFLHVHPESDVAPDWRGGPEVSFSTTFHEPGVYRAWGQFQRGGETFTSAFDLQVEPGAHH